jgi:hypothetical protein
MTFNGKNNLKTIRLAFERANYALNAFPEDAKQVVDFNFAEKTFYGRVNRQLEPVVALDDFLEPITVASQDGNSPRAMNFVIDQFRDMELHFAKACRLGAIPIDDPILSSLKVKRAFEDPLESFKSYSSTTMRNFIDEKLLNNNTIVKNYEHFLMLFLDHVKSIDNSSTFTLSDFMKSNNSNIFMSGLALDIGGLSFSDDSQKQQQMLNSPAFEYYLNIANQYGFSVDRLNPGLLVSDLAHPVTSEYRTRRNVPSIRSVFDIQYEKTIFRDLDLLNQLLIDSYNTYINLNPYNSEYKACNDNTIVKINYLNYNSSNDINYNLIIIYINIKNVFEGTPLSQSEMSSLIKTANRLDKIDRNKMLIFIEDQFKSYYNQKDGSLTYYRKRLKNT